MSSLPAVLVQPFGPASRDVAGGGGLILAAEADDCERARIEARLRRVGFEVLTAASGADLLDLARHSDPAMFLLDLHLPDRDAFELAAQIRREPTSSQAAVVLMSSRLSTRDWSRAHQVGVDCFLNKPINLDEMEALIRRIFLATARTSE